MNDNSDKIIMFNTIPGGFNIILNLSRRFDMRFINLILSNFIGQLTTSMVEIYIYIYVCVLFLQ